MRMSRDATPATQNHATTCFDMVRQNRFCSFPHRHGEATGKPETRDETCWSIRTNMSRQASSEFSYGPQNLLPQNRCFVQGFHQFSAHLTKCHTCHGICTLSPLEAALTMRFAEDSEDEPQDTSSAAPATQNEDGHIQSAAPATKPATHLLKTLQKYCACRTKPLSTRYETHLNVTKCHGCHAKRGYVTCETSKSHSCRTRHRHGHIATSREQLRTVADGCGRKRNVERTLATHSGKKEP